MQILLFKELDFPLKDISKSLLKDVTPQSKLKNSDISKLCSSVSIDKRFHYGVDGTDIFIGGYNDPFDNEEIQSTLEVIKYFGKYNNYIHIATKYPINESNIEVLRNSKNLIINYSVSCFKTGIELNNHSERFNSAKALIRKNVKTALYLRPIIYQKTINDLDKIIKYSKDAGITVITVGGLYVDDDIIEKLKNSDISLNKLNYYKKSFVLDNNSILRKIKINDLEQIIEKLTSEGFKVFSSSDERIDYFRTLI